MNGLQGKADGIVTRFAPSPTGPLHLGHAFSAIKAHDMARDAGGVFLLRIEDIDRSRSRPEWEGAIYEALHWLGLTWAEPVMRQSDRLNVYRQAIEMLWDKELIYPCTCNRRDIAAAVSAPQEGADPRHGPDGVIYPGICRPARPLSGPLPMGAALRLDMRRAWDLIGDDPSFIEENQEPVTLTYNTAIDGIGDIVIARRDMGTSYHLSVVLDDAAQGVTHVVRGRDLFDATLIHIVLQRILGLPTPRYHHHRLIRDDSGKRLAKRDDAKAIATFRAAGATAQDIRRMIGL